MKRFSFVVFNIVLIWIFFPNFLFAQENVHFGTIFIEDVQYEDSDQIKAINSLTDQSPKQTELEVLYKSEVGEVNKELKKINSSPRLPSSTNSSPSPLAPKLGVVRNQELPKQIVYFVEVRSFEGHSAKPVHREPNLTSDIPLRLQPGEMVKIIDTPDEYVHKMRMDRDNQGLWKKLYTREQDLNSAYIYYDWRNYETITSHDFPVELDILVPYGLNSISTFNRPGPWTHTDCALASDLCVDSIDIHTQAYLFDITVIELPKIGSDLVQHQLYYKIGYQTKDRSGVVQHKVGWIPSHHAKRRISQLPKSLLATRSPNSFGTYESDEERMQRLRKYYVFDANLESENKNLSRWINSVPGQSTEVFFQNIAIDGVANFNTFTLRQSFLTEEFTQSGIAVGAGIYAPIFIDLEVQGTATLTIPVSANENDIFQKTYLFRGEQWLLYTTPLSVSGTPFKFGVGGYYLSMFAADKNFGFNSLVGFQVKALFENPRFWLGTRYGPTGQDFNFRFENRELGADFGWRLNPEKKYESWSVFGDLSDTSFTNPKNENATKFQILQFGVRKQF